MVAPYEADAIDRASRMLVKVWSARDPDKKQLDEFAKAQKDATVANPLAAMPLPLIYARRKVMDSDLNGWEHD
jgi:hypothetical protein